MIYLHKLPVAVIDLKDYSFQADESKFFDYLGNILGEIIPLSRCIFCTETPNKGRVPASEIERFRTANNQPTWTVPARIPDSSRRYNNANPPGAHSGNLTGSGRFHNELKAMIDESKMLSEFNEAVERLSICWNIQPNLPNLMDI